MIKAYDQMIEKLKYYHPEDWQKRISEFLDHQLAFYNQCPNLALIEIQYNLKYNMDYPGFCDRFQDIFMKFDVEDLAQKQVTKDDQTFLLQRYCTELQKYKEDISHANT